MFKIWAKILDEDKKMIKDIVYVNEQKFNIVDFSEYMIDVCNLLDIPTPAILSYHSNNYEKFNYVKFLPRDFVEKVSFDSLLIENGAN